MRFVLDASVAIKLYAAETDSQLALEWVSREVDFAAPDIFFVEVGQALLRHCREGRLTRGDLQDALSELETLVSEVAPSRSLIRRALGLAHVLSHGLHDCLYLALAERLGCSLLTADAALFHKVQQNEFSTPVLLLSETL